MKKAFKSLAKEFGKKSKKAFTLTEAEKKNLTKLKIKKKKIINKLPKKMKKLGTKVNFNNLY